MAKLRSDVGPEPGVARPKDSIRIPSACQGCGMSDLAWSLARLLLQ